MRNMILKFGALVVVGWLAGFGCVAKNAVPNTANVAPNTAAPVTSTVADTDASPLDLSGNWLYAGDSKYGGTEAVSLDLRVILGDAQGTFTAVLNRGQVAARHISGEITGTYDADRQEITADWSDDRGMGGTLTLKWDEKTDELIWVAKAPADESNDKDFAVPKKMRLVWNMAPALSFDIVNIILDEATKYTLGQPSLRGSSLTLETVVGDVAQVTVLPDDLEENLQWIYLVRQGSGWQVWQVVLGPAKKFSPEDLARYKIPAVMRVNLSLK